MKKPTWATVIGVIMLLFGGCGAFNDFQNINAEKILEFQNDMIIEMENEKIITTSEDTKKGTQPNKEMDSLAQKRMSKVLFGDTIVMDSLNQPDIESTVKSVLKFSDYRIMWTKRFGYIGLLISLLFIVGGVLFLAYKKYTIKANIAIIALSIGVAIFELFIYMSDTESGKMISTFGNVGIYVGIFLDVILLIIIMVMDKSYYNQDLISEDYYD